MLRLAFALAILAPWLGHSAAEAALDPELKKPYRLEIVLGVARHRLLTDIFADRLEHELRDELKAVLGDLAQVTTTRRHPLLGEARDKGLARALDGYKKVTEIKTHFVILDFEDGQYKIQARQHDGMTGLASPQVRRDQTADRRLVSRKAAALVELDFGLVGTVTSVEKQVVKLAIKAGGLGAPLKSWVDTGEVFAIAAMHRGGGGLVSAPLQWALLQVSAPPRDGVCTCRLYNRFQTDNLTGQADVLGYRCLKLGTLKGAPLRLRLLDFKTHAPHDSLQVHVSGMDFGEGGKKLATDRDGMVPSTGETYSHVVFVRVLSGGKTRAQIPVALVSPETVDCLVSISPQAEAQGQIEVRKERWLRRIYDSVRAATDRVSELNDLGKQAKRQEALDRAREGLESMAGDLKSLNAERERLAKDAAGLDLSEGEHRLADLARRRQELDRYATRLGKVLKEEKDPAKLKMLSSIEQARLYETQAEYQQALDLYELLLKDHPKEMAIRKRYGQLEKAWAVQNDEHRKAREYIYKTWPKLVDPGALKAGVNQARESFKVFQKYGDNLSPQKLLRAIDAHAGNLKKRFATLKPQASEDDRKEGETIVAVAADLKKLHGEVTAYLKAEKPMFP